MAKRWYIVHAYSNFERKVAEAIKADPARPVGKLPLLGASDRRQLETWVPAYGEAQRMAAAVMPHKNVPQRMSTTAS